MFKNNHEVNRNWFFIILLTISSLSLAGTAAYFSIFGLSKLFFGAGIGIIILASVLEFSKLVAVSYVYRYWKVINKWLRGYYVGGVLFIMLLTSLGIYGFLTSAYQNTANRVEVRDSQVQISENKKTLFVAQLERINTSIENDNNRIKDLSSVRRQQETRLDTLYQRYQITNAKRTEEYISGADEQINVLNKNITEKMKEANSVNDSIAYYDQKILELKASDVSSEVGPLKYLSDLTGIPMNKVVNILVLLIIFVFDPMAITLLIGVNQLTMMQKSNSELKKERIKLPNIKEIFKKREEKQEEKEKEESVTRFPAFYSKEEEYEEEDNFKEEEKEEEDNFIEEEEKEEEFKKKDIFEGCQDGFKEEKIDLKLDSIHEGLNVYHNTFGYGKIVKCSLDKSSVFILFESGKKELSPEYANLKEIICIKEEKKDELDFPFEEKQIEEPEAVPYLIFKEDDPEYQEIHKISEKKIEEEKIAEDKVEDSQKKTLLQKIWKGKKII